MRKKTNLTPEQREVYSIHEWLRRRYTKDIGCQNIYCANESRGLDFAKRKGFKHERKRENYYVLCHRCHHYYDRRIGNPKRLKEIIRLRRKGLFWKDIGKALKMDFRNAAREYHMFHRKFEIREQHSQQEEWG